MTSLVIKRPRDDIEGRDRYQIVIDDGRVVSIEPGETIWFALGTGHHEVTARAGWVGSQSIAVEAETDTAYELIVAQNRKFHLPWIIAAVLVGVALMGTILALPTGSQWASGVVENGWRGLIPPLALPLIILMILIGIGPLAFARKSALSLVQVSDCDLTVEEIADLLRAQPLRPRFSVRVTMVVVAILAVVLAVGVQQSKSQRQFHFRNRAKMHAEIERLVRTSQDESSQLAASLEKSGFDATAERQAAGKAAAKADYHAAMRQKYEHAASLGWFTVEPDPPAPRWP
jgi:hypothetical protein